VSRKNLKLHLHQAQHVKQ